MKLFKLGILALLMGSIVSACQGPNKNTDNQEVSDVSSQDENPITDTRQSNADDDQIDAPADVEQEMNQSEGVEQGTENHNKQEERVKRQKVEGEVTGNEIVKNTSGKLIEKLRLSEQQSETIMTILSQRLEATGRQLTENYPGEESIMIGKELISLSQEDIAQVLNERQKVHFEKFMNK